MRWTEHTERSFSNLSPGTERTPTLPTSPYLADRVTHSDLVAAADGLSLTRSSTGTERHRLSTRVHIPRTEKPRHGAVTANVRDKQTAVEDPYIEPRVMIGGNGVSGLQETSCRRTTKRDI